MCLVYLIHDYDVTVGDNVVNLIDMLNVICHAICMNRA